MTGPDPALTILYNRLYGAIERELQHCDDRLVDGLLCALGIIDRAEEENWHKEEKE